LKNTLMLAKVAIAQINCTVGDLAGNAAKILAVCETAAGLQADIVVTPELSLLGYPAEDLLLRHALYDRTDQVLGQLCADLARFPHLYVVVGHPQQDHEGHRYNCASVLHAGRVVGTYRKHELPNYDVFDEVRYFTSHDQPLVFSVKGITFGLNLCEDIWYPYAPGAAKKAGAEVLLVPNASPYHMGKQSQRYDIVQERVRETGMPLVYANLVGGQDELVFDGASFVIDAYGQLQAQLPLCTEQLEIIEFEAAGEGSDRHIYTHRAHIAPEQSLEAQVYAVLVLGVRDYMSKNGFPGAIIGLSGGIDSALTLAIAVDALGADKVRTVMMPSPYTADISWMDAREMAQRLKVRYDEISISPMFEAFKTQLATQFTGLPEDTTEENIQARIRGTLLMALSNKTGAIVLTTGNKSEMATGYCTLYGDMAGGFAVIKDIFKTLVYRLSRWRNEVDEVIPERIITRAPSAELRPNQTDQDSLPPYEVLDEILRFYMEEDTPVAEILRMGYEGTTVQRVVRLLRVNEYKRRQAPVGVRITRRGFGRDWRYPITSKFKE
jgi:NAD+ synthase (glutamine-hydrolysing)